MSITYTLNKEHNGIEIKFSDKPTKKVLEQLKKLGFRWHSTKGVWYAKQSEERIAFAKSIQDLIEYTQTELFESKEEKQVGTKSKPQAEKKTTSKKGTKKADKNVVDFPSQISFTFGSPVKDYTIADCEKKINAEKDKYTGADHRYVLDGVLALCKESEVFRSHFMAEEKDYTKAFAYVTKYARSHAKNGCCVLDGDKVLEIVIEYYNEEEKQVKEG